MSVYDETRTAYDEVDVNGLEPVKRADLLRRGYRRCPNPSADMPEHYLPATWGDYADPLAIGLVGLTSSGKTHLLTAMIREAHRGGLLPYGVQVRPLDFVRHNSFKQTFIGPFERGVELPGTGSDVVDAADILLLRAGGQVRPLMFFDVNGEDLKNYDVRSRAGRFVLSVNAAIFVHGAEEVRNDAGSGENPTFELSIERILNRPMLSDIPVSIALTKADRLRYVPPADRWLRRAEPNFAWRDVRAESRDVYAYLYRSGAIASLAPYESFSRCSLHFVSASGGDAVHAERGRSSGVFPRGIRPLRVLDPLISLLSMTGFLRVPEAERMGRW
ncbi:hypothetical protein [Pseudonocardia lacus]|uniref:hypothetical protein n=1 Tax=Pseudonocardia lacus TaxID=2835865 RepID=UPI001BDD0EDA|nr:hypothetical protein [Pseudonocardia lacus]